jgi:predicted DNA-binding transcriptional regulator AlpA
MHQFGTATRPPKKEFVPGRRLIAPQLLQAKGIYYAMSHLRRMWKRGEFPEPIKLTARKIAWDERDIDRWIMRKIKEGKAA